MARNKASKKVEPVETEDKPKPVRLDLTPAVHRALRKVAADADMSMAAFARDAIERVLAEEMKKRGLK